MTSPSATLTGRQALGRWVLEYVGPDLVVRDLRNEALRDPAWPADGGYAAIEDHVCADYEGGALDALERAWLAQAAQSGPAFTGGYPAAARYWLGSVGAVTTLTACELRAIRRAYQGADDEHTFHVAVVSFGCGRSPGQVRDVLRHFDPVTRRRWADPALREYEAVAMLPRAAAAARPCGRVHSGLTSPTLAGQPRP
jgi:hypothetical protein